MRSVVFILMFIVFLSHSSSQPKNAGAVQHNARDPMSTETFNDLKFRSIGPAVTSGRVGDFAVHPRDRSHYYVAVSSGGVWKTTNAGTTWQPVFDSEGSFSIGCITMDPENSAVIWVGTGENNSQRSVSYGDGVYRSEDGGKSWTNLGLRSSEHIGKILIDPRNTNVVYVASQGPLWRSGGERGLFKTTNGGITWDSVLFISGHTGVTDVVMDPRNPEVLYAASYQRRRHVYTLINGGPESAIYKSTNAGATWKKLTGGLPADDVGRIGLAISPVNPDILFATIELPNRKGGFYRSTDRGATWEKRSDYVSGSPQYYSEIFADPQDVNRVYSMDVYLKITVDGGTTFTNLGEKNKHVDNHAIWIDPANTNYYLVGCDGGIYESFDRGATWSFKANFPVTQFYRVTVDNALPFYNVYGGTQDNFTLGGPSRTTSITGIENADWIVTVGGDGFETQVDPENPDIVYSQSQHGGLIRFDRKSGEIMGIKPQEGRGEEAYRWNWDSPLLISPHSPTRLYFAANKLFRSDDRGNSWHAVSGDLTRRIDRNTLPVMDKVWGIDAVAKNASTSLFGNITALSESPRVEGLIYAGTDDGLIQVTEDGGTTWRRLEKIPGVPAMSYVSRVEASQHDAGTVYAAFDNHKNGDFLPYILKSMDRGKSWISIRSDLPENGVVYAIAEDHVTTELLFVGTEFGVFTSVDGGNAWIRLKGGLPTIAVRDIAIQKRENDLVLGTFGRGFFILDDYTLLRSISKDLLGKEGYLFSPKDALMYHPSRPYGLRGKGFQGESFFAAENPPFGATFAYYLKESPKTRKQLRQEAEKEAVKKGETPRYPTFDELRVEDEEEAPSVFLTIRDEAGGTVRRLLAPASRGIHRVTWDLRYPAITPTRLSAPDEDAFSEGEAGHLAMPGKYSVSLSMRVNGAVTELAGPQHFSAVVLATTTLPASDRKELVAFQQKVGDLQRAVMGASRAVDEAKTRLTLLEKAIFETPAAPVMLREALAGAEAKANTIIRALRGDRTVRTRFEPYPPSIINRVDGIVDDQWMSTSAPTKTQQDAYAIAGEEFEPQLALLRTLIETDIRNIESGLERAGGPWTPGRIPEWKKR